VIIQLLHDKTVEAMQHLLIPPTCVDEAVAKFTAEHTNAVVQNCARALTWAADEHVLGTLAAVVWVSSRSGTSQQRALANHVALMLAAAVSVPKVIKQAVDRTRPDRVVPGLDRHGVKKSGHPHDSFPSGHSVHIGAMVSALSGAYPKKTAIFWTAGAVLAATRAYVLAHWTTDVIVGMTLGVLVERGLRPAKRRG
jgi:membrane-associated phospholipid phosphatase